jgi:hypothetical protein
VPLTKEIGLDLEMTYILSRMKARPTLVGMEESSGEETTSSCRSCYSSAMAPRISSCNAFTSFRRSSLLVLDKDAARIVGVTC